MIRPWHNTLLYALGGISVGLTLVWVLHRAVQPPEKPVARTYVATAYLYPKVPAKRYQAIRWSEQPVIHYH